MSQAQKMLTDYIDVWTSADVGKKSGRGRVSSDAANLYGIQKLRELILELAVRGKLVPQDDNDEPADQLIKRIVAEKLKLNAEGKIKKDKSLSIIGDDEKPFELPNTWQWAQLGFIGNTQTGTTPSKSNVENFGADIPFIKPGDIYPNYVDYGNEGLSFFGANQSGRIALSGSILMVCIGTIGKCNLIERDCSFNQQINSVTPYILESRYLLYVCRSPYFYSEAWSRSSSTTIAILNKGNWEEIYIPIPPLEEQRRIAAKVDELMVLCDQLETQHTKAVDAHEKLVNHLLGTLTKSHGESDFNAIWQLIVAHFELLFNTESSIEALKQSLLQLAVMGKLVAQDRNDEPASELLKRIQAEKANSVAEGKIKRDKALPSISVTEKRFAIPAGWVWVRFNLLANTRLGKMLDQAKNRGIFRPYLRNTNVQWNTFELDDLKEMRFEENELDEYRLNLGDLVICEGGEPGRSAVWQNQIEDMFIQKALHRARPWSGISPYFLNMCLKADVDSGYLEQFFTGATIKHFSGEKLSSYPVALPPENEQIRIVSKAEELIAICDQLKSKITAARQAQKNLANVLVEQALIA